MYFFNNIRYKEIFDMISNNEENLEGALINFALENGITGNVYKKYILYTLIYNENNYTMAIERSKNIKDFSLAISDLKIFYDLYTKNINYSSLDNFDIRKNHNDYLLIDELYQSIEANLCFDNFKTKLFEFYSTYGLSDMAFYKAFRIKDNKLSPIKNTLNITFDDIIGYDYQKELLIENTLNFINSNSFNNVLLYGDSGTGKSSSIKALLNKFYDKGLRIIEVYKHQMEFISNIIDDLRRRPFNYILYMDDLSFEDNEVEYKYLKSVIEGGIEPKPDNVVIYATSNRKHLIKETIKDNDFDDLHRNETKAEKLSLAYRFGLQIYYGILTKKQYFDMVLELARRNNITLDDNIITSEANAWEVRYGSFSGRCATQFINHLKNRK